ncbi:MAG: hypothetical protein K2X86_02535 [Cytophagaceae bacterium]|nr:hypothetical protein [Cytophagaceae bacterium]
MNNLINNEHIYNYSENFSDLLIQYLNEETENESDGKNPEINISHPEE